MRGFFDIRTDTRTIVTVTPFARRNDKLPRPTAHAQNWQIRPPARASPRPGHCAPSRRSGRADNFSADHRSEVHLSGIRRTTKVGGQAYASFGIPMHCGRRTTFGYL